MAHAEVRAAVAGTFNVLHDGHRALIDRALEEGGEVIVGITSDPMASAERGDILPFYMRRKAVEDYISSKGRTAVFESIDDIYGPPGMLDSVDVLVVSEESLKNGRKVAERAASEGRSLRLSVVPMVMSSDGTRISATGVMEGRYSRHGAAGPRIAVGSANHVKVEAVREVMERIYGDAIIIPRDVPSGVPEQPFGDETYRGALNRARAALGDCDLSVGIEAGVFELYGELIDIQHCVVLDRDGRVTVGMGSGFAYPPEVAGMVRSGMTVGRAMDALHGRESVGHSEGAIGILSRGLLDRKGLTQQAVLAAMVPRL